MVRKIFLAITVLTLIIISSCKDNGAGPDNLEPGRRDYTWTTDTLRANPEGWQYLWSIWGTSPNDIWAIGDAWTYVNKVWHYDGAKWSNYLLSEYTEPCRMCGISSNEMWMVSTNSQIWKYDGQKWFKYTTIIPEGCIRIMFLDVHGYSKNIFAVGLAEKANGDYTGVIIHYDGTKWSLLNTPYIKEQFQQVRFTLNGDVLVMSKNFFPSDKPMKIYRYKDGNLTVVQSSKYATKLEILGGKLYLTDGMKIYEYKNEAFDEVLDFSGTKFMGGIHGGRSIKDFFTINTGFDLGHYNGNDLESIYPFSSYINSSLIFEKEVFFTCLSTDKKSYVLHGILK